MASAYTTSLIKTFLAQHLTDILPAIADTGLFFPAVVAQLSVESANGTSQLSSEYNNYGGIKGNSNDGVLMDTTETNARTPVKQYFKTYSDFKAFMADYVSNLTNDSRYINGGVFQATSPEDQIKKIAAAGYTTMSPNSYLKTTGIQDRINATRSLFPIGQISSSQVTSYLPACCYSVSICSILHLNDVLPTTPVCGN